MHITYVCMYVQYVRTYILYVHVACADQSAECASVPANYKLLICYCTIPWQIIVMKNCQLIA